jgi:hypothetical protein
MIDGGDIARHRDMYHKLVLFLRCGFLWRGASRAPVWGLRTERLVAFAFQPAGRMDAGGKHSLRFDATAR